MVKKRLFDFIVAMIASIFSVVILSCAGTAGGGGGVDSNETALSVSLPANRSQWAVTDVQSFTVTISSSSYKDTKSAAGGETITFSAIPVGHYTVEALGKNSNGDLTAKGGAEVDIVADTVTEAVVTLNRLNYYTVRFLDSDNTLLNTVKVTEGYTVACPEGPNVDFAYWRDTGGRHDFTLPVTEDLDLTAVYGYTITYYANPASYDVATGYDVYSTGTALTLPTPTIAVTGYDFVGWYTNSDFTGSAVNEIPSTATGTKTFYAKWTTSVVLNGNGGQIGPDNTHTENGVIYGKSLSDIITGYTPSKTGYDFLGWNNSSTATSALDLSTATVTTGNPTYYAIWGSNTFSGTVLEFTSTTFGNTSTAENPYSVTLTNASTSDLASIYTAIVDKEIYCDLDFSSCTGSINIIDVPPANVKSIKFNAGNWIQTSRANEDAQYTYTTSEAVVLNRTNLEDYTWVWSSN